MKGKEISPPELIFTGPCRSLAEDSATQAGGAHSVLTDPKKPQLSSKKESIKGGLDLKSMKFRS